MTYARSRSIAFVALLALAGCGSSPTPEATPAAADSGAIETTTATLEPAPGDPPANRDARAPEAAPMPGTTPSPASAPSSACGADKAGALIGKAATPEVRAQVAAAVGHDRIRWIGPDTAVTMDFSEDRLNADLDAQDRIKGFRCG